MTGRDNASDSSEHAVIAEIEIMAPPERVFQALTDESQLVRWFSDPSCLTETYDFEPRRGGRWRFVTREAEKPANGVTRFEAEGEILEFEPPRLLVYTWVANWHSDPGLRTVVRWELDPIPGGARVRVTHSGLQSDPVARKDYAGGWVGVLKYLQQFLAPA